MSEGNGVPQPVPQPPPVTGSEVRDNSPESTAAGPRGYVRLAWLAVALFAGIIIFLQNVAPRGGNAATVQEGARLVIQELQMRLVVGMWHTLATNKEVADETREDTRKTVLRQAASFNRNAIDQRLRSMIVLGEVAGPERAVEEMAELEKKIEEAGYTPTPAESVHIDILRRLYQDFADGRHDPFTVGPEERMRLLDDFGWFGELALNPSLGEDAAPSPERLRAIDAAKRTFQTAATVAVVLVGVIVVGVLGLFMLGLRAWMGRWRDQLGPPVAHHGIYVETFALWIGVYVALLFAVPHVLSGFVSSNVASGTAMLLSLLVLAWPVCRGVRWRQVRADIGLHFGRQPFLEPTYGIISYAFCLAILPLGVIYMMALTTIRTWLAAPIAEHDPFRPDPTLAHPVVEQFSRGEVADWLPLLIMVGFIAPLMEEIMFRGCLYRHLRDGTRGWKFWSFVASAVVVNMLFGIVHPQGVLAAPLLASLAGGFVIAREWRGTLVPAVIAHGINNTFVLGLLMLMLMR